MKQTKKSVNLPLAALQIRKGIVNATHAAGSGHPGGSLGSADIMAHLYFSEMKIDPKNPTMPNRDRFVLSKGHCAPGLYSTLANRGFFPVEDLVTLRKQGSYLQGHPNMITVPGVDMSTGSLGQGISAACGMALGAKLSGDKYRVYALLGDGELGEGECWEAFMFAAHHKLDNLCAIIDLNGLQIDGATKDVMDSSPVDKKLEAFNFNVITIDGNNFDEIATAFEKAKKTKNKPTVIIAKTVKGKGVSFMENQASWHGKAPNADEHAKAIEELNNAETKLISAAEAKPDTAKKSAKSKGGKA